METPSVSICWDYNYLKKYFILSLFKYIFVSKSDKLNVCAINQATFAV